MMTLILVVGALAIGVWIGMHVVLLTVAADNEVAKLKEEVKTDVEKL